MNEKLKPLPENINTEKLEQFPKDFSFELVNSDAAPMSQFITDYSIRVHEQLEENIFGVITQTALANGIKYEYAINKDFVINAMKNAIPTKPTDKIQIGVSSDGKRYEGKCPVCREEVKQPKWGEKQSYCEKCGQKLDWSDEDD